MEFDLIVIGAGPGGYTAAIKAAQLGMKTAIIEKKKNLGGTCLNVGCIPSKALLSSSELYHQAKHQFEVHGINAEGLSVDVATMMKRKDGVIRKMARGIDYLIKKNNIEHFIGTGSIINSSEVEVDQGAQKKRLKTKRILIATGSKVSDLPFLDYDGSTVLSSDHAIALDQAPDSMIVIGGGAIGLELGSVWARLGTKVDIIEPLPRIATIFDESVTQPLQELLQKQGIKFHLNTRVESAEKTKTGIKLTASKDNNKIELEAEKILIAVGRKPNTDNLEADEMQIELDERGFIQIDANWQTNIPGIYAIGDVVAGPMLAHKAEEEGIAVAELIAGQSGHVNYDIIPSVIYTSPEVASVGKTEEQLKESKNNYKVGKFPFMANSRAKAIDESEGFVKILADATTDKVLGVHIIGPHAGEMIAEMSVAMEFGASSEDIARTCHAHPTHTEAIKEAALAVDKRPIHF